MIATVEAQTLMLAVGLDDLTLGRVRAAVRGTELSVELVSPEIAVERARAEDGPVIGLLEWKEELEAERIALCDALRSAAPPGRCYILALGGLSDPALARAMDGPANDVLSRPFGGEVLLRLRQAVRAVRSARLPVTPREALDEAVKSAQGGEVVVRSGEVVGTIHVQNGFVVWANLSSVPATMDEVVRHAGIDLAPDVIAAAKEECRATRTHFMDVLVTWKLIDPHRAKEAVRSFVADRVKRVLELPHASALFLPKLRQHTEHLRIGVQEIPSLHRILTRSILPVPPERPAAQAPLPLERLAVVLEEAARIDGAVSAAILDRKTGASLLLAGADLDTSVAWSQLGVLAALGPSAEDVFGAAGERCFVTRPLRMAPTLALFVVFAQATTTVGLARALVAQIATADPSESRLPTPPSVA